uniref:Uncharacterized protein n=1 Tax=Anopheles culicifacies TaxID=139723 RepID=A0A182M1K8_9DIPT
MDQNTHPHQGPNDDEGMLHRATDHPYTTTRTCSAPLNDTIKVNKTPQNDNPYPCAADRETFSLSRYTSRIVTWGPLAFFCLFLHISPRGAIYPLEKNPVQEGLSEPLTFDGQADH